MKRTEAEKVAWRAYQAAWREKNPTYYKDRRERNIEQARKREGELREQHRDRTRTTHAKWVAENSERNKEHKKNWYAENKDNEDYKARRLETGRRLYLQNPAKYRERTYQWAADNPEKVKRTKSATHLRKTYGITIEEHEALFAKQKKRCGICKSLTSNGKGFHTDHCHKTRKVRGILCSSCNLMLGHAKDNIVTLKAAIKYLNKEKMCA
jgi:hypothetical protein